MLRLGFVRFPDGGIPFGLGSRLFRLGLLGFLLLLGDDEVRALQMLLARQLLRGAPFHHQALSHYLRNVYWSLLGEVHWGKWKLSAYYLKPQKLLLGETIATFENNADIRLAYRPNNQLSLVLICMYPFSNKADVV